MPPSSTTSFCRNELRLDGWGIGRLGWAVHEVSRTPLVTGRERRYHSPSHLPNQQNQGRRHKGHRLGRARPARGRR